MTEGIKITGPNRIAITSDWLDQLVKKAPYYSPVAAAVKLGFGFSAVFPGEGPYGPWDRSAGGCIMLIGADVPNDPYKPSDYGSISQYLRDAACISLVVCDPPLEAYVAAATAAIVGQLGVIIEVHPDHEQLWYDFIQAHKTTAKVILCTERVAGHA